MTIERTGLISLSGKDVTVVGPDIEVGQQAPHFTALATDWSEVDVLESSQGKVRIIGSLPSLSTSVCDRETRRFNQAAANLSDEIVVIMLSTDLPYTQKNWCSAAGVDRVFTYSDNLNVEFGTQYGVLIKERRVLRRSIFVVNRANEVVYADYMPTLGDEPKYDEVLQAARDALEN
jgi:thiol peroxidase